MSSLFQTDVVIADNFSDKADVVVCQSDTLETCQRLPDNTFSLIITSPPYNIGKAYEQQVELEQYLDLQGQVITELVRTLRDNGSIVWQVGNYVENSEVFPLDIYFYPIFKRLGMKLRNRIVWHFDHGLHASKRFSGRYEVLLWLTKSDDYTFNLDAVRVPAKYPGKRHYKGDKRGQLSGNPLGKNPSDFWTFVQNEWDLGIIDIPNVKSNHPEKTIHPCQFPIELVERCVLALTSPGDWVLDPFGGVGSSIIAAIKNQRKGMSIDRDPNYSALAKKRIGMFLNGELKLRPIGKPIHKPNGNEKVAQVPIEWLTTMETK